MTSGTFGAPVSAMPPEPPEPLEPPVPTGGFDPSGTLVGGGFTEESCFSPASGERFESPGPSVLELQDEAQSTQSAENTRAQQDLTVAVVRRMEICTVSLLIPISATAQLPSH